MIPLSVTASSQIRFLFESVDDINFDSVYQELCECSWGSKPTPPGASSTPLPPPSAAIVPGFSAAEIAAYERHLALNKMGGAQAPMHQQVQQMGTASQAIYDGGFPGIASTQPPLYYQ